MRLFVALDVPLEVRRALGDLVDRLRPENPAARWVNAEGLHVTLKFIGHAVATGDAEKLDAVRSALGTIRLEEPVEMSFQGIGVFPNAAHPRVLWCGVKASQNLAVLADSIDRALVLPGIPAEERSFTPHLTLARFKTPYGRKSRPPSAAGKSSPPGKGMGNLAHLAAELAERIFGSARETEFHLFESVTKPSGAEYRKIETYPFVEGAA